MYVHVCHFYDVIFICFNWYQPCNETTTIAGDIVDNDCDGLIDEETNNGIGMLHYIVLQYCSKGSENGRVVTIDSV